MAKSFLRIRPMIGCSSKEQNSVFFKLNLTKVECRPPSSSQAFKNSKSSQQIKELKRKIFEFDKVLDEETKQEQLYNDCVQPLLTEFFNGENVLLFAYGTTSSGKTYTMRGDSRHPGVVPRCISDIFQSVESKLLFVPSFKKSRFNEWEQMSKFDLKRETDLKSTILNSVDDKLLNLNDLKFRPEGFKSFLKDDDNICHIVWVSFLELYNENLVDLLAINPPSNHTSSSAYASSLPYYYSNASTSSTNERTVPLKVMRDQQQNFFVSGLTQVYVNSAEEAMKVYLFGIDNLKKHISSTAMNPTSSRSHSLFTISVITLKKKSESDFRVVHVNNFSLCDLAGQERGKKTQTTGVHLKEAGKINKSLFTLKRCIQIIKEKKNSSSQLVIPFTESVLTKAFQPYLSGSGLTFMIININPQAEHFDETINSLEFSATASEVIVVKQDSANSLKEKLQRFTQFWLQTSKRWSTIQDYTNNNTNVPGALITGDLTCKYVGQNSKSSEGRDDTIVDSQNLLKNQKYDSTFFEESITQKVREMEETIVEYDLYDAQFVEDLNNRIDELEQQIANADPNISGPSREANLESIYNSITEIYKRHDLEKENVKKRMNDLMNERMEMLTEQHNFQVEDYQKDIEDLNLQILCKDSELERARETVDEHSKHITKLTEELKEERTSHEVTKMQLESKNLEIEELIRSKEELKRCKDHEIEELRRSNEELRKSKDLQLDEQLKLKELELQTMRDYLKASEKQFKEERLHWDLKYCLNSLVDRVDYEQRLDARKDGDTVGKANESNLIDLINLQCEDESKPRHSKSTRFSLTEADYPEQQVKNRLNKSNLMSFIESFNVNNASLLNSTTTQSTMKPIQMQNGDLLLGQEFEEIKKQKEEAETEIKQLRVLLDLKEEQIGKLRTENQRIHKELNKTIKEEGFSIISCNNAKITKNLYTSVLNHTSIVGNNTPYKPLSQMTSARKKRPLDEENSYQPSTVSSDAKYIDLIKNTEKNPTTEKKIKKKRTTETCKHKTVKEEVKIESKIIEEEDDKDEPMDDLAFLVEETAKKKPKKSRPNKEVATSVRKKIPLEECRESFIFENDDLIVSSQETKKKLTRRTRRKIEYK